MSESVTNLREAFEKERLYFRKSKSQNSIVPNEAERKIVNDYIEDVVLVKNVNGIIHKYVDAYFVMLNCSANPTVSVQTCFQKHEFFNDIQAAKRVNYKIEVMQSSRWISFGEWNSNDGLTIENHQRRLRHFNQRVVSHDKAVYHVGVVCDTPYIQCEGNGRYSGYAIKLLNKIKEDYNFTTVYHRYSKFLKSR